ncbi:hyphally regulated cell wall protein 1 [Chelonus insularis]|uniref:hyphally regulated cell wall protein 1 n=1 Tax=Chelonus insularis TaxID=460826 RepID=UPI00158A97AD|nr:hyphally regulated cell wall protein 1-like [Chelonus insularis]XP_034947449.1 hyphally regulated cell wall protein 1-like [Chelonus insularis]XP_034947450.1 hyphally regulated cell wall protein 1-like [Chelonus insularis]
MDLTEAFAPGNETEDLGKTDFFDFVVSPSLSATPSHCTSGGITSSTSFIKETNNNTLPALPPVSTITGSLNHHSVRSHCIQSSEQIPMDQSDCDYWGTDDGKEQQTCNILLEDLNKYCWSAHANPTCRGDTPDSENHRVSSANDRQNTDGAIYTLTVLNNEANSMDGLDCCKSPVAPSNDSWSLRPNIDLDAILNLESSHNDQDSHDVQTSAEVSRSTERYHIISTTPSSQYATDDSGFVESKELCRGQSNPTGDNNNDWKLSDQNHLQEVSGDSAESLLRNALQGKLYSGPTQITLPSTKSSPISVSLSTSCSGGSQMITDHQQQTQHQQQQEQQDESMHGCTEEDLLLSQLETTTYRPGDYEKLKSIANEVVESYCNLEPVCNVSATTTVMYTLDPTSGSLGTITLPADLGQVGTVTVVTATQQDLIEQTTPRAEENPSTTSQIQVVSARATNTTGTKAPKKYSRKNSRNNSNSNANGSSTTGSANGNDGGQHQGNGSGSSPSATVQRKERSLHYCNICHKGFKDKYSVNVHIRTHTGEKPFACSLCGKSFRQKAHLAKHYQTHVTQKPNVGNGTSCGSSTTTSTPSPTANSSRGSHTAETAVCSPSS